ncbi:putative thioredoxin-like ferredoxin [Helianthus annuus]|nr:putative thioredoxin-like ferredoxin [Helianthus annuus]
MKNLRYILVFAIEGEDDFSHVIKDDFPLPKVLAGALEARKNDIHVKTLLTICEGREGTELSDGDVLLFPEMIKYRSICATVMCISCTFTMKSGVRLTQLNLFSYWISLGVIWLEEKVKVMFLWT